VVKELWNNYIKPRLVSTSVKYLKDNKISISPNPVHNELKIKSDNNFIQRVDILDYSGKTAKSFSGFSQDDIRLNVSDLIAGNYLLSLSGLNNFRATEKMVKN
jgi:SOS-response transcriptional repressor LexA